MVRLGDFVVILDLRRQGASIARQPGLDRKTVRRYVERTLEPPPYEPRPRHANTLSLFGSYLRERFATYHE